MTSYSNDLHALKSPQYRALQEEAKKLRAAARRAEAKGDHEKAAVLRDKVDGIKWALAAMRS